MDQDKKEQVQAKKTDEDKMQPASQMLGFWGH